MYLVLKHNILINKILFLKCVLWIRFHMSDISVIGYFGIISQFQKVRYPKGDIDGKKLEADHLLIKIFVAKNHNRVALKHP